MAEGAPGRPRATMEEERRFTARSLSWPDELRHFALALHDYADTALQLHRRHGDGVRKRLPRRAVWLCHPRHLRRVFRTNVERVDDRPVHTRPISTLRFARPLRMRVRLR